MFAWLHLQDSKKMCTTSVIVARHAGTLLRPAGLVLSSALCQDVHLCLEHRDLGASRLDNYLNRNFFSCFLVGTQLHLGKMAGAQGLADIILVRDVGRNGVADNRLRHGESLCGVRHYSSQADRFLHGVQRGWASSLNRERRPFGPWVTLENGHTHTQDAHVHVHVHVLGG